MGGVCTPNRTEIEKSRDLSYEKNKSVRPPMERDAMREMEDLVYFKESDPKE
jgi:hypothetical protein